MRNLEIEFAYSIFSAAHRCVSAKKNNGGVNTPNGACYQNI